MAPSFGPRFQWRNPRQVASVSSPHLRAIPLPLPHPLAACLPARRRHPTLPPPLMGPFDFLFLPGTLLPGKRLDPRADHPCRGGAGRKRASQGRCARPSGPGAPAHRSRPLHLTRVDQEYSLSRGRDACSDWLLHGLRGDLHGAPHGMERCRLRRPGNAPPQKACGLGVIPTVEPAIFSLPPSACDLPHPPTVASSRTPA